jgi:hypothetical protein
MAVAEPTTAYGLWPRVKALSGWPESNEDALAVLAEDWRTGSDTFAAAAQHPLAAVNAAWGDPAGQTMVARASANLDTALDSANRMSRLSGITKGFAGHVADTKTGIRDLVESNVAPYAMTAMLPPGVARAAQDNVVHTLAGRVNEMMTTAAAAVRDGVSQNGWPVDPPRQSRLIPGTNTKVIVADGPAGDVLLHVLAQVDRRVEDIDLKSTKGELDDWGYANRPVRGSTAVSNHASATAVDINATRHPLGAAGTFSPAQVQEIHNILNEVDGTVRWGGDYSGRKDEMHFEINAPQAKVADVAARLPPPG